MRVVIAGGEVVELGTTEAGPTIGIIDYSRRVTDDFGVTTVVERDFARRMTVRVAVPFEQADAIQRRLAELRATTALWVADDRYSSLSVEGFYKDFSLDLNLPPVSYFTLTVEGLAASAPFVDPGGDPAPQGSTSTLKLLQPATIADANLIASNVPEADHPEWSAGTTYGLGARVIKAATHKIYESAIGGNVGKDPASSAEWIEVGATNRWAMFDQALGSATTRASPIAVTLDVGAVSAVALLDVVGATVRVQAPGYDQTQAVSSGPVTFLNLPAAGGQVTITVSGPADVAVGTLLIGKLVTLGITEAAPTAEITDFSRKETDEFGEITVVERAWAKRMTAKALIRSDAVDLVAGRIAAVRARPSLWIGETGMNSLTVYGFFKDFSIEVGETVSKLSLSIEGLSEAPPEGAVEPPVTWADLGQLARQDFVYFDSGHIKESISGADATLVNFKTPVGIAAGFAGQGGLATLNAAPWGTHVTGRPAELTDGRIAAGLDASGDLARNLTMARANASNLLRYNSGGLFTGELTADQTSTHIAAGFTGQAALATKNAVDLASSDVLNKSLANLDVTASTKLGGIATGAGRNVVDYYIRSASRPATPTGNGTPVGWSRDPNITEWTLNVSGITASANNTVMKKTGGTANTYDAAFWSSQTFVGLRVAFKASQTNLYFSVGLNSDPSTDHDYLSIDYELHCNNAGQLYVRLSGVIQGGGALATYTTANTLSIEHVIDTTVTPNTASIVFAKDGVAFWTVNGVSPTLALAVDSSFYSSNAELNSLSVGSMFGGGSNPVWRSSAEKDASDVLWGVYSTPILHNDFNRVGGSTKPENNATVGARAGTNLYRTDGLTVMTQAEVRTPEGIAAGFTGQAALATMSAAPWSTHITGRPAELTDGRIAAGLDASGDLARNLTMARANASNLLRYNSGGLFTGELTADQTSTHIAAGITGQGPFATLTRITDPRAQLNAQIQVGPSNTTNIAPSYTVGASNVTVNIPAHVRKVAGGAGPVTLNYGAGAGTVAFNAVWFCYVDDTTLSGISSPTYTFTTDASQLLYPGRYHVASGTAPGSSGTGGTTGGGGGGGGSFDPNYQIP